MQPSLLKPVPVTNATNNASSQVAAVTITEERQRFENQRRRVYIAVGMVGTLLLLYDTRSGLTAATFNNHIYVINNTFFACCTAVLTYLGYTRRQPIIVLERWVFWLLAFESFTFNSVSPWWAQFSVQRLLIETVADDVWLLLLVCTLGVHIFPRRRGALLAAGLYGASLAVTGSYLWYQVQRGDDTVLASVIIQTYIVGAMLLAFLYLLAYYRDQAQRIRLHYELLEHLAFIDGLTTLPNRRSLEGTLQQQVELAQRYHVPFCIALLDIDYFKRINDTHGHAAGDEVLRQIGTAARTALRSTDSFGRWGGEEFLLILPQTAPAEAHIATERIAAAISAQVRVADQPVTLSGGVATYFAGEDLNQFLARADSALYKAKFNGRNQVYAA